MKKIILSIFAFKNPSTAKPIIILIEEARIDAIVVVNRTIVMKYLLEPWKTCDRIHLRDPFWRDFSKGSFPGENST